MSNTSVEAAVGALVIAVAVGFFLEFLLQAATSPFLPFGYHFLLNLTQGVWFLLMTIHSPFWQLYCFTLFALGEEPNSSKSIHHGGSVKMSPFFKKRNCSGGLTI